MTTKTYIYIIVPFLFLVASALCSVFSYASLGTVGGELYAITLKTEQLHAQNQRLTESLAQKQSLKNTLLTAESKGYVPVTKLTQIDAQDTKVALQVSTGN